MLYCSKDCQRAHWKANHKHYCISKLDRTSQRAVPLGTVGGDVSSQADVGDKCVICLDLLSEESICTLPCAHSFHQKCVAELRKLGVQQVCPLCRVPLSPGPEKLFEDAIRRYVMVRRQVERGCASWSALPASAQHEVDAAVSDWQTAADEGFAQAQFALGFVFEDGTGVAQSNELAAHWYKKAAEQGNADAQCNLGSLFAKGGGVAQCMVTAALWFKKAAEQGHADAQFGLGSAFQNASGVAQNDLKAVFWFQKAANQGQAWAQFKMGFMTSSGRGFPQSYIKAAQW